MSSKKSKTAETKARESVKEMMNMMPQMIQNMSMDPTEVVQQTAQAWTRSFEMVNQLTSKLNDEMWSQSMKSFDETQKIYRTNLETLQGWSDTWRAQTQQNVQRFLDMTKTSWK